MTTALSWKQRFFNCWAPSYDWLIPSVFYQAMHQRLLAYVSLPERAQVLDLGCGTGKLLNRLAADDPMLQGTGLDLASAMVQQARAANRHHPQLIFVQGDAASLPFSDRQFDAVFNTVSFLHYPDPDRVLAEVKRVLRPGGRFYLADSSSRAIAGIRQLPGGIRLYSQTAREELGARAGLECLGHHYLLGPVMLTVFTPAER